MEFEYDDVDVFIQGYKKLEVGKVYRDDDGDVIYCTKSRRAVLLSTGNDYPLTDEYDEKSIFLELGAKLTLKGKKGA